MSLVRLKLSPTAPVSATCSSITALKRKSERPAPPCSSGAEKTTMPCAAALVQNSRSTSPLASQRSVWGTASLSRKARTESRKSWWSSSKIVRRTRLPEDDEDVAFLDRVALGDADLGDGAGVLGLDRHLHLDRLDDHHLVADRDRVTDRAFDFPDGARDVGPHVSHEFSPRPWPGFYTPGGRGGARRCAGVGEGSKGEWARKGPAQGRGAMVVPAWRERAKPRGRRRARRPRRRPACRASTSTATSPWSPAATAASAWGSPTPWRVP